MIAVSFDFDGVLAKSPFAYGVLFPVLDEMAVVYADRMGIAAEDAKHQVREIIWGKFRGRIAAEDYVHAYDWQNLVSLAAADLDLPFTQSLPELTLEFADSLVRSGDRSMVYAHAHETLRKLQEQDVHLLMLTNGYRAYQFPTAEALGLADYFRGFFASDDLGTVKPFADAFHKAFDSCGDADADRYHIGDSLTQDVAGAREAGITAIWVHRELPDNLMKLTPRDRAGDPAIKTVIGEKLVGENQSAMTFTAEQCHPDAVVASLNEIGQALW